MKPFSVNFAIPAEKIKIDLLTQYDPKIESTIIKGSYRNKKLFINNSIANLTTGSMITATQTDPTSDEASDR